MKKNDKKKENLEKNFNNFGADKKKHANYP